MKIMILRRLDSRLKNIKLLLTAVGLIFVVAYITFLVFNTKFAKVTIDAWSFMAAVFLIVEALVKISITDDKIWPWQAMRVFRVIIGVCVFTIHTCQVIYGI